MFETEDKYYDRMADEHEDPRDYEQEACAKESWAEEFYSDN